MPNDTKTRHTVPDVKIEDWIEKFNKAKGWDSYKVPTPKPVDWRDENQKFMSLGEDYFERRLDTLGDADDLKNEIEEAKKKQSALQLELAQATTEDEIKRIEGELQKLGDTLKAKAHELSTVERLEGSLKTVKALEDTLSDDLKATGKRLQELEERIDNTDKLPKIPVKGDKGYEAAQQYIHFHDSVAQNIENYRQEVIPLTTTDKNGIPVTRNYAGVNSDEYRILFGMLEESRLLFKLGEVGEANTKVRETLERANEYRAARTGQVKPKSVETFGKGLDDELVVARGMLQTMRDLGYGAAADHYQGLHDKLVQNARTALNTAPEDLTGKLLNEATLLSAEIGKQLDYGRTAQTLLAEAMRNVESMRVNGHSDRPQRIVDMIGKLIPGADLMLMRGEAQTIFDKSRELLDRTKQRDLEKLKVDPEALKKDFDRASERFDKLFKHDDDGNVKTQKDTKTGLLKGIKKNKDLPREALEELELRLQAAEQLLESDSVTALQIADTYVGNVNIFLDNIDQNPQWYAEFAEKMRIMKSYFNGVEKDFALYEVSKRADLKAEMEKLGKEYLTGSRYTVNEKYLALMQKMRDYETACKELRIEKNTLVGTANTIEKRLDEIGKVLKDKLTMSDPGLAEGENGFTGYHGRYRTDLEEARAKIEGRTAETLKQANTQLFKLYGEVTLMLDSIKRHAKMEKTGKGEVSSEDYVRAKELINDATNGQKSKNANEAAKGTYELAVAELEKQAEIVEANIKKLRADPSGIDALTDELDALKKEVKADANYLDALERMKEMSGRMARLLLDTSSSAEIVDATLGKAAELVVGHIAAFEAGVKEFYDKTIVPAAVDDKGNSLIDDTAFKEKPLKDFLASLVAALPQAALKELPGAAAIVADGGRGKSERKAARKTALAAVRATMAVLDGFKPVAHFRMHPFPNVNAITALNAARLGLPRLEMRLLTAIAD
jgi:hypothetical protein